MLRLIPLAVLLIAGCGKSGDPPDIPIVGLPTGAPTGTTTGTTSTAAHLEIEESGIVVCPNPAIRANGFYERRTAPHPPSNGSYLWGGGVISGDFDGDGTNDLFVTGEAAPQLWLTVPALVAQDVEFQQVEAGLSSMNLDFTVGGTAADMDADGDLDLVLSRWERPNALLLNEGDHFVDATPAAWQANAYKTQSASVADMDGDGDLDVFFGNYGETPDTYDAPDMPPADPAELYRNEGDTFTDVSSSLPDEVHDGYTFASGWWQVWGDEKLDLVVANDFGKVRPSVVARNLGSGTFSVDTYWHENWEDMGMAVADVNGDGVVDFLYSSWKSLSVMASGVNYGLPGQWLESNTAWGIQADVANRNQVYGWGAEWGDLDNDGDQDAMVLFGYWSTYTEAGDPLAQVDGLFQQTGLLSFEQTGGDASWNVNDSSRTRGLVFSDLNDDGYLDILKGQPEGDSLMYLSRCGNNAWLKVRLRDTTTANTQAIGAKVRITSGAQTQTRWLHAGSSGMYGGAPPEVHFGMGGREFVDELEITWPDGSIDLLHAVTGKQIVTITRVPVGSVETQ